MYLWTRKSLLNVKIHLNLHPDVAFFEGNLPLQYIVYWQC